MDPPADGRARRAVEIYFSSRLCTYDIIDNGRETPDCEVTFRAQ